MCSRTRWRCSMAVDTEGQALRPDRPEAFPAAESSVACDARAVYASHGGRKRA